MRYASKNRSNDPNATGSILAWGWDGAPDAGPTDVADGFRSAVLALATKEFAAVVIGPGVSLHQLALVQSTTMGLWGARPEPTWLLCTSLPPQEADARLSHAGARGLTTSPAELPQRLEQAMAQEPPRRRAHLYVEAFSEEKFGVGGLMQAIAMYAADGTAVAEQLAVDAEDTAKVRRGALEMSKLAVEVGDLRTDWIASKLIEDLSSGATVPSGQVPALLKSFSAGVLSLLLVAQVQG